jgi:secondary thiamine-phosphate synthase enzyme
VDVFRKTLHLGTRKKGLHEITGAVEGTVEESRLEAGTVTVFCAHTSCSLVLMENADPSARRDLEDWLDRLVPENDPHFTHTLEGADDMPSHIKMALSRSSESIPVADGRLLLGTWQGIFLWEHRVRPHQRRIEVSCLGSFSE